MGSTASASMPPSRTRSPSSLRRRSHSRRSLDLSGVLADDGHARTSASRRRSPSCGPRRWDGASPTSSCRSVAAAGSRPPTSLAARGERAVGGRAGAARHADQPDLRGLDRDHAPAHRAGGRRRAPHGRRRPDRSAIATSARKAEGRRLRPVGSTPRWLPQLVVGQGRPCRRRTTSSVRSRQHLRYVERTSAQARARRRSTGWRAGRASLERKQGFLGPHRRHRRRAVRDRGVVRAGGDDRGRDDPSTARRRTELADTFCRAVQACAPTRLLDALWHNTDAADERLAARVLDGRYAWLEEGILDPSEGTGPWISEEVPADAMENVARHVIRPVDEAAPNRTRRRDDGQAGRLRDHPPHRLLRTRPLPAPQHRQLRQVLHRPPHGGAGEVRRLGPRRHSGPRAS